MARSAEASDGGNDVLLRHLDQLGWSMRGFAFRVRTRCEAVGLSYTVSPSTVSRWCKHGAIPSVELAAAACHVLSSARRQHVTPESLGWPADTADIAAESLEYKDLSHAVRMLSKLWELDAMRRRSVVKSTFFPGVFGPASREALVMPPDTNIAGLGRYKITTADIELLEDHTVLYGKLDAQHGGGKFRSVFADFLSTHAVQLLNGGFSARAGRRLYGGVADAVLAMASMAYDDQLPGLAQRYDLQAMRLAQAIGDRARIARVHIHQARLAASLGDRKDVLTHSRSAVLSSDGAPPLVKAYAAITEARAWAFNGSPGQVLHAVARAREAFDRAGAASNPRWLAWFDQHELEAQAAWALTMADLVEPGTQALKTALGMPGERARDNVELLITAAELARLRGDLSEQAELTKRAVESSRHLMSRRLTARISRLTADKPLDDF
ncbi:transcriptional regulator [Streptomyces violens]|uniref:transcriptional regulator n=1 Tax=Streptomyces violens TaxID=66377 RepID=UPI001FE23717|nr:transcriptional regulator [Streptomyces violens]